jgi:hypothetical protein
MKPLVSDARRRSLAAVNSELVLLYWSIGKTIVAQQEKHAWGDKVVDRLSADLRAAFPEMRGLSIKNLWKMRNFFVSYRRIGQWHESSNPSTADCSESANTQIVSTVSRQLPSSVATYQTALPDEELIQRRLEGLENSVIAEDRMIGV